MRRFVVTTLALGLAAGSSYGAIASSDFTAGDDGWVWGDATYSYWLDVGGNPGGYMRFIDPSNSNNGFIYAPAKFLGDWTEATGLTYDFKVFQSDTTDYDSELPIGPYRVAIVGTNGLEAVWQGATPPGLTEWLTIDVPLDRAAWSGDGAATDASWNQTISDVAEFRVAMELFTNTAIADERTGMDNVVLLPGAWSAAGLAACPWYTRRRRAGNDPR